MKLTRTWSHEQVSSFASLIHSILGADRNLLAEMQSVRKPVKTNRFMMYYRFGIEWWSIKTKVTSLVWKCKK